MHVKIALTRILKNLKNSTSKDSKLIFLMLMIYSIVESAKQLLKSVAIVMTPNATTE